MNYKRLSEYVNALSSKMAFYEGAGLTPEGFKKMLANESMKVETLEKIANYLEVPIGNFFEETSTVADLPAYNLFDLDSRAAAGTALLLLDDDKRKIKPNAFLPGLGLGLHIRMPIGGDSMYPTIKDGDRPVATRVEERADIRQGWPHIIIDTEDGVVCKRVYVHDNRTLELTSDNDIYKPYFRPVSSILALFRIIQNHTTDLRPFMNDVRMEMQKVKQDIAEIQRRLKMIE